VRAALRHMMKFRKDMLGFSRAAMSDMIAEDLEYAAPVVDTLHPGRHEWISYEISNGLNSICISRVYRNTSQSDTALTSNGSKSSRERISSTDGLIFQFFWAGILEQIF